MIETQRLQDAIKTYHLTKYIKEDLDNLDRDIDPEVIKHKEDLNARLHDVLKALKDLAIANGEIHISVEGLNEAEQQLFINRFRVLIQDPIAQGLRSITDVIANEHIRALHRSPRLANEDRQDIHERDRVEQDYFNRYSGNFTNYCLNVAQNYVKNLAMLVSTPPRNRPN